MRLLIIYASIFALVFTFLATLLFIANRIVSHSELSEAKPWEIITGSFITSLFWPICIIYAIIKLLRK